MQTSRGTTRHPWAVNVAVKEEEEQSLEKIFDDENAGSMIWIPPGEISIWVPYAEESRLVQVKWFLDGEISCNTTDLRKSNGIKSQL